MFLRALASGCLGSTLDVPQSPLLTSDADRLMAMCERHRVSARSLDQLAAVLMH